MQRVDLPDAETANTQILDDLNNAARGIVLVFEGAVSDYGYALPATEAAIEAVLKGVHLDWGVPWSWISVRPRGKRQCSSRTT